MHDQQYAASAKLKDFWCSSSMETARQSPAVLLKISTDFSVFSWPEVFENCGSFWMEVLSLFVVLKIYSCHLPLLQIKWHNGIARVLLVSTVEALNQQPSKHICFRNTSLSPFSPPLHALFIALVTAFSTFYIKENLQRSQPPFQQALQKGFSEGCFSKVYSS